MRNNQELDKPTPEWMGKTYPQTIHLTGRPLAFLVPQEASTGSPNLVEKVFSHLEGYCPDLYVIISPLVNLDGIHLDYGSKLLLDDFDRITGSLEFDKNLSTKIRDLISGEFTKPGEFTLNDQLQIFQHLHQFYPSSKIISIMIGSLEIEKAVDIGRIIADENMQRNPLLIAITTQNTYRWQEIEYCDSSHFLKFAHQDKKDPNHQFAYAPVAAALEFSNKSGGHNYSVLPNLPSWYETESNLTSKYGAMLWEYRPPQLGQEHHDELIAIAFDTLKNYLLSREIHPYKTNELEFAKKYGVFITIRQNSNLRGCIGNLHSSDPLVIAVQKLTIAAATADPRFSPINLGELPLISIKISILSPPQRIKKDQIEIGKHGLMIIHQGRKGVLLPSVAAEREWNVPTYLSHLCIKAGLDQKILDENPRIYAFTTLEFESSCPQSIFE